MGGNQTSDEPRPSTVTSLLTKVKDWLTASPRHLGYAVVLLGLLLTIPFGGLRPAASDDAAGPTAVGVREETTVEPWRISVRKVLWGPDLGDSPFTASSDGRQHVVVSMDVINTSPVTVSTYDLAKTVRLVGLPGATTLAGEPLDPSAAAPADGIYTVGEQAVDTLAALAPGVTYRVALHYWSTADATDEVQVTLRALDYRAPFMDDTTMMWWDGSDVATVTVPVEAVEPPPAQEESR